MSRVVHLIDNDGNKKVIESKNLNESDNENYHIDIDWYLSNGYVKLEDARRQIEGVYYEQMNLFLENENHDLNDEI